MNRVKKKGLCCGFGLLLICGAGSVLAQTLDECVKIALENNLDFQRQQLNPRLMDSELKREKSYKFGRVGVVSSYTHYNLPRTLAPLTPASIALDAASVPTTEDLFNAAVVYELPLFTGFARTRSVEVSKLQREMAYAAVSLSREQLIYNVKTLYVNLLAVRAQIKAQEAYVASLQRMYDDISREVTLGKKARIDALKAAADLKNGCNRLVQLESELSIMKGSLAVLLNIDKLGQLHDINISPEPIETIPVGVAGLQRLKAARLAAEKDLLLVKKVQAARYPQLYLNASYGENFGPNDDSNKYRGDWNSEIVWQAGVTLKWDVFNFGNTKSKVQKARIAAKQSSFEQARVEQELSRALKEAVARINVAVSDYCSAQDELELTSETEKIEQVRFDQGQTDTADLLYAKARNQLAQSQLVNAGYKYKTACFYLDYLLEQGEKQ